MKTFQFPSGTTKISKKELAKAFTEYERVEIPGTVLRIDVVFEVEETTGFVAKQLVLSEGIQSLRLWAHKALSVNVPKSLQMINTNVCLPRVLCLPETFIKMDRGELTGVEYLQAYCDSEVRNCFHRDSELKHYVYLGEKTSHKPYLFDDIPAGCVIHVESNKVANKVLKRLGFGVLTTYVIPDALEWKDFPADKLALTMEEYDPESRITPAQIKLQKEKAEEQAREAEKKVQEELDSQRFWREYNKNKLLSEMLLPLVNSFLSDKELEYKVSKEVKEGELGIQFQLSKGQYMLSGIKSESPEESLRQIVETAQKVRGLYSRYQADIEALHICVCIDDYFANSMERMCASKVFYKGSEVDPNDLAIAWQYHIGKPKCGDFENCPYMTIPLTNDVYVIGNMRIESLATDSAAIISFANELKLILNDAASKELKLIFSNKDCLCR